MATDNNRQDGESAFNFAVAYLQQINDVLKLCNMFQLRRDKNSWLSSLHTLHTTVSIKTNKEEDDEIFTKFKEINETINDNSKDGETLTKLRQMDMHLRKLIQRKGMALPSKDDPRWAVLRR